MNYLCKFKMGYVLHPIFGLIEFSLDVKGV